MEDNSVTYWQAVLKVGFDIEEAPKEKIPPKAANKERLAQPSAAKEQKVSGKYRCKVCGYIYDPEKGDPDNGVAPGTAFEDLPDDWKCPECGVNKEQFEAIK
ncbi:MAG: hypothetical protein COV72_01905 [Candidatus Omnitrophica bacterium CG11_big_fil_rev_8_21_14_0_20_42_13]|uniref:Rubredoxin n=1 Tax=Candidatus Ghiorseimicrobium undicola TaxID=1974746 RepID=A0A2H0M1U1_9BACT|nr:MAG: hypothetical protein COV72_01905 [Candidatus Omnitrophica bacterium CG11_big_fil_rev_8_21_14_0_20_42_13]